MHDDDYKEKTAQLHLMIIIVFVFYVLSSEILKSFLPLEQPSTTTTIAFE